MGRHDIAEVGKRFTSEYQPAGRGRPKGSLNCRTILKAWLEARTPRPPEEEIQTMLDAVLGKRKARRVRRRLKKDREKRAARRSCGSGSKGGGS